MNIKSRLKKMENGLSRHDDPEQVFWDFSKTTDEQLQRLKALLQSENTPDAEKFTQELLKTGFLSRRLVTFKFSGDI